MTAYDVHRHIRLSRVTAVVPSPCGSWLAVAVSRLDRDEKKYVSDLWRVPIPARTEPMQFVYASDDAYVFLNPANFEQLSLPRPEVGPTWLRDSINVEVAFRGDKPIGFWPQGEYQRSLAPVRLTHGDFDDKAPCFRRDGALGFLSRRPLQPGAKAEEGEDERAQVWILPAHGGEAVPLTDEPLGVSAFKFASDGDRLILVADMLPGVPHEKQRETAAERKKKGPSALLYTEMPVRFWDHWLPAEAPHYIACDENGGNRRDLTPDADREFRETDWDLTPDGTRLIAIAAGLADDRLPQHRLRVYQTDGSGHRELPGERRGEYASPRVSPDGRWVAVRTEIRHVKAAGTYALAMINLETGASQRLVPTWDRSGAPQAWTRDGKILVLADDEGAVPLFEIDPDGPIRRLTENDGTHEGISRARNTDVLVGIRHTHLHPPEPFVIDDRGPRIVAQLSGFTEQDGHAIARRERFKATSFDGAAIDTLVLVPTGAQQPSPTLLWIHGGPIGAWADGWHWRWNPLLAVAAGYVVALPNPRGSTGYGHDFIAGIWGNTWGAACYDDILAATDVLTQQPYVDADRMAAMGGSFGGYMANWLGGNEPKDDQTSRFRCIVTHASLYDMSSFQAVTDWPEWLVHEFGLSPYDDVEAFERYSPHRFVSRWRTPALIIHGEKDYRVPISEGLALFEALQRQGTPSELLVFPDENHWILRPRNIVAWYEHVLGFLGRHIIKESGEQSRRVEAHSQIGESHK